MTRSSRPSLAETHPKLASQSDGWDPAEVTPSSNKKLNWKCDFGHQWSARVAHRAHGIGCPICSNQMVLAGFNDLATTHPEIAAQADGWDPKTVVAGSNKKLTWRCVFGHVWESRPHKRTNGSGCPVCSGNRVLAGFNDLATTHPEIAAQANGWDPTSLSKGSNQEVSWKCTLGHIWKALVNARVGGSGCPICANQQVLAGYNDLATVNPELATQADGWDPTQFLPHTKTLLGWKCDAGHTWNTQLQNRSRGHGCPICANQQVLAGYNDLATVNPELATQADGWDPRTVTNSARKTVRWKCEHGHKWNAAIYSRSSGVGCPICSNQQLLAGYNDLATSHPELAAQADGWDPTTVVAGSPKKAKWVCEQGHRWSSSLASRSLKGVGCPSCAKYGFDPNLPGFFYLIDHFDWQMLQIGITNYPEDRLTRHGHLGWTVIELRGPMDGHLTRSLETATLQALGRRSAVFANHTDIQAFDGWSEAWLRSSQNVSSIKELFDFVYEYESK